MRRRAMRSAAAPVTTAEIAIIKVLPVDVPVLGSARSARLSGAIDVVVALVPATWVMDIGVVVFAMFDVAGLVPAGAVVVA